MEVIKIEIKKTVLELLTPEKGLIEIIDLELEPLRYNSRLRPKERGYKRIEYQVEEVVDSEGNSKQFLVSVDDRDIFIDLVNISNNEINRRIQKVVEEKERGWEINKIGIIRNTSMFTAVNTKIRIQNLPWYKRLFNQF